MNKPHETESDKSSPASSKKDSRVTIINAVQTPLGFFVLIVLVLEVTLGVAAGFSSGNDKTYLIIGMIILIIMLVLIVAGMAFFRPASLYGILPKTHETSLQVPQTVSSRPHTTQITEWYRNGKMLPLICFEVIARNISEEDAKALGNFSSALQESLLNTLGEENLEWSASNRGFYWIVVSERNNSKALVDLAEDVIRRAKELNHVEKKNGLSYTIQIRAALHCGSIYSVRGMSKQVRWELFGEGVDLTVKLANAGLSGHVLCTEIIGKMLLGDPRYVPITHQLHGKYRVAKSEIVVFNLYNEDGFGNPHEPTIGQVYPEWKTRLGDLLDRVGVRPSREVSNFVAEVGEDTIAIDDVISLVESPGFQGWDTPEEIEIERVVTPITEFPQNWERIKAKYGSLDGREEDKPKLFVDEWDPYIIDQGGKLHIRLGESSYIQNKALERLLREDVNVRIKGKSTTLHEFYKGRDEDRRSYFWTYLPNMIVVTPVVITADNQFIAIRRSPRVSYYRLCWSISIEEQMNPAEDSPTGEMDNYSLAFFNAIHRGIHEELGGRIQIENVKILGLHREYSNCNVNVAAVARISQEAAVVNEMWTAAYDRHEGTTFDYRPFEPETVVQTLSRQSYLPFRADITTEDKFHGGARYRLLMAALAEFDQDEFRSAILQAGR
jgi:hypothetical protein